MKSTKNKKQLMVLMFLYLILSTNLMLLGKTINSNKNNYNHRKKYTLNNKENKSLSFKYFSKFNSEKMRSNSNVTTKRFPFKNPLGNFLGGLVEQMAYGENRFYDCFPKSWLNDDKVDQEGENHTSKISGNLTKWVEGLSAFISLAAPVIQFFCKFKTKIINFIQGHFMKSKLKKFRIMFESGQGAKATKLLSKKYGWGNLSKFGKAILDGFKKGGNWVKEQAKNVGKFIKENIVDPVFNNWFLPIKNKVLSLIQKIKDFFSSDFITRIQNCVDRLAEVQGKFSIIFKGLKQKFNNLKSSMRLGYASLVVFAADFIVALVCEYQYLVEGISFIMKGADKIEENDRYYDLGKGVGVLFRTFATAPTVVEKITNGKKFKRLYFK